MKQNCKCSIFKPWSSFVVMIAAGSWLSASATAFGQSPIETTDSINEQIPTYTNLEEIVIQANSPLLKSDGSKLEYNVAEDPTAASSSVLDILRKTPLVTVDGQDNIQVNGNGNYKLLINGKEEPMVQQNASLILKNMPAAAVSRIEVITDPGAKYDAEGVGGVLNIVIGQQQKSTDGYNGQLSLTFGRQNSNISAYGTMKHRNVTIGANVTYADGHIFPMHQEQNAIYEYRNNPALSDMHSWQKSRQEFGFTNAAINASWEPNATNLFTASVSLTNVDADIKTFNTFSRSFSHTGDLLFGNDQSITGGMSVINASGNLSYQHNFRPDNNFLTLSYLFNFGRNRLDLLTGYDKTYNFQPEYKYLSSDNTNFTREHTVQADYTNDFASEHHLLETGFKGIFRRNGSFSYQNQGNDNISLSPVPDAYQVFSQYQDIYAAYASWSGTFGALSSRAGVRYEHTDMGMKFHVGNNPDFNRSLDDVVPNASVAWAFNPATNIRLGYNMRISRPTVQQVNPFETNLRGESIRKGNPDLESERNNTIRLTFSKFGRVFGGNIGVEYSNTSNAISSYSYMRDNVLVTTEANIGRREEVAFTGFINWNIIPGMSANVSGRLAYNYLCAPSLKAKSYGWTGNVNAAWSYRTASSYTFSAYGGYSAKNIQLQGSFSGYHYYGLSAGKDMLKDKTLNVTLTAMNMFEDRSVFRTITDTPDLYSNSTFKMLSWNVGVTISWKFGNSNTKVKKTNNEIENDDKAGSNSGNGNGISL
ncbi:MAG: TonB-dependent receptor [Clostridium sp.]|nr:TonB-dependent receptor [Prevotella sp.]MCM1428736.1 TonB-dependent receptor [Clostridium sp.]MCM1475111.1 TonB-dependent receptor [Muribaculaceae bacterium]